MTEVRRLAVLAVLLPALQGCADEPALPARARHLLLISVDTLRADRLGCYGGANATSPTIDALAAGGTLFEQAYTPRGQTLPAAASLFTSRYPDEHGIHDNQSVLGEDEWTLAERLAEAGFRCRGFTANPVLQGGETQIDQGFAEDDHVLEKDERELTRRAVALLGAGFGDAGREFLWLHYMNPHRPYEPEAPYDALFTDPGYAGPWTGSKEDVDRIFAEQVDLQPEDLHHLRGLYDGTIRFVDDRIAEVLAALAASGRAEETLVVFLSDHGEDLYSHHRYFYHIKSIYRSSDAIPLILHQPGVVPAGQRLTDLAEIVDVLPTVLRHLGLDPGRGEPAVRPRGLDLWPAIGEARALRRDVAVSQWKDRIYAIRTRAWSYISNPDEVVPSGPPAPDGYRVQREELYHLVNDPDEQVNVLARHRDVADKLAARLMTWQQALARGQATSIDDPETIATLRELGYVGGAEDGGE